MVNTEYLIDEPDLPKGFTYPGAFLRVVNQGLIDLTPWYIIDKDQALKRLAGLKDRYPTRSLIPFARRDDNDDVACFEIGQEHSVTIVHDFASSGYETKKKLDTFWDWFKYAVDEMILFEP
jgi:hypothetical protein